eukprot:364858-Chlamydomonas_euryale.AAC.8
MDTICRHAGMQASRQTGRQPASQPAMSGRQAYHIHHGCMHVTRASMHACMSCMAHAFSSMYALI